MITQGTTWTELREGRKTSEIIYLECALVLIMHLKKHMNIFEHEKLYKHFMIGNLSCECYSYRN